MASPITAGELDGLFACFGESGTYTPNGGSGSTIVAVVDRGASQIRTDAGELIETADVLTFQRSDLDPPARDSTWTNGTTTWLIGDIIDRDEDVVRVEARENA